MAKDKVFLGGTCNNSTWRNDLIKMLRIDYFNPVVEDWTPECMIEELKQRQECTFCLYVITPEMEGVYSIAEAVDDSNKQPHKTIFCPLEKYSGKEFSKSQMKSLDAVGKMIARNGGVYLNSLEQTATFLNAKEKGKEGDIFVKYCQACESWNGHIRIKSAWQCTRCGRRIL